MAKDAFYAQFVGTFIVKPCCAGMAAFMWLMLTPSRFTHPVEQLKETAIANWLAIHSDKRPAILRQPPLIITYYLAADGHHPVSASFGLTVTDDKIS